MKKLYYLIVLALILGLVLTGCSLLSNISQVPTTNQSGITYSMKGGPTETEADEYILYAGQDIPVGTVNVWNDLGILYVRYVVDAPWEVTCSHLYVGKTDPINFPSTPGQFPYSSGMEKSPSPSASYDDTTMTYTIPLDEIYEYEFVGKGQGKGLNALEGTAGGVVVTEEIFIATHAEVQREYFEPVWQIGDVEENNLVNPYDEFNYPAQVTGTQDFYVDTTLTTNFPYFSDYPGYAPIINIYFNAEMLLGGRFLFSWSPGNSGTETIEVSLGGTKLGEVTRSGTSTSGWWKSQERFIDSFDVPATEARDHVLTINVTAGNGLVWDWLRLEEQCIQEESAWAVDEDASHYFGKNWATYFTYHIAGVPPTISSDDLAGPYNKDEDGEFSVKTVNPPYGFEYPRVIFNYIIEGIDLSGINTFDYKYWDDVAGIFKWGEMPKENDGLGNVTGFFGPLPGCFPMEVNYSEETTFRINIGIIGTFPVTITLINCDNNEVITTFTEYVVVLPETLLEIGDSYDGGIVAYILQPGESNGVYNYDKNVQHGLIAAIADATSIMPWSNITGTLIGTTGIEIGDGQENTTLIVDQIVGTTQCTSGAAYYCDNLTIGVYDDWFLPSKDELNGMYVNLHLQGLGGFSSSGYWSSSEYDADYAWAQLFGADYKFYYYKYLSLLVRAVRAF